MLISLIFLVSFWRVRSCGFGPAVSGAPLGVSRLSADLLSPFSARNTRSCSRAAALMSGGLSPPVLGGNYPVLTTWPQSSAPPQDGWGCSGSGWTRRSSCGSLPGVCVLLPPCTRRRTRWWSWAAAAWRPPWATLLRPGWSSSTRPGVDTASSTRAHGRTWHKMLKVPNPCWRVQQQTSFKTHKQFNHNYSIKKQ